MSSKNDKELFEADPEFLEFLDLLKEVFEAGARINLAFWRGLWYGEDARKRTVKPEADPRIEFAFELGCQLKPAWQEIDKAVMSALVGAAVGAILRALGLDKGKAL